MMEKRKEVSLIALADSSVGLGGIKGCKKLIDANMLHFRQGKVADG